MSLQVCDADVDGELLAVEDFGFVHESGVCHDDAVTLNILFRIFELPEKLDTRFMEKGKKRVIANVASVIQIGDSHRDLTT